MLTMIEESVESFLLRYRPYAALVEVLPHLEGSPLLECVVGTSVLHLLERTGPYLAKPGRAKVVLNATAERLEPAEAPGKKLEVTGLSRLRVAGLVLEREEDSLIVDAGVPLVVNVFGALPLEFAVGDWIRFESVPPLHGFVVPAEARVERRRAGEGDRDSL